MRTTLLLALGISIAPIAGATPQQAVDLDPLNAKGFLALCSERDDYSKLAWAFYMRGIVETVIGMQLRGIAGNLDCSPGSTTPGELRETFLRYLAAKPDSQDLTTVYLKMMAEKYPCATTGTTSRHP